MVPLGMNGNTPKRYAQTASCLRGSEMGILDFFLLCSLHHLLNFLNVHIFSPNDQALNFLTYKDSNFQKMVENLYSVCSHGAVGSSENYLKSNVSFFLRKGNMRHLTHTVF